MKKIYAIFTTMLCVLACFQAQAQTTVTIGTGTTTAYWYGPLTATTITSWPVSRHAAIYSALELTGAGAPAGGGLITRVRWNKVDASAYTASNATLRIYMKNVPAATFPTTTVTLATEYAGASLVYSSTTQNISSAIGWENFTLNTPFFWDGTSNVEIIVDWDMPSAASGFMYWQYHNSFNNSAYNYALSSPPTTIPRYSQRPNIQFVIEALRSLDAGATAITNPTNPITPGAVTVQGTIRNYGTTTLTSANIYTRIDSNGTIRNFGPTAWSGSLATGATSAPTNFMPSAFTFGDGNYTIKSWTDAPNGGTDLLRGNDTITSTYVACNPLNGTYTVNPAAAASSTNFTSFNAVAARLNSCGISGPVVFNVAAGAVFTEQVEFRRVVGSSATNTITFNGNNATIKFLSLSSGRREIIYLNGAKHFRFNNLNVNADGYVTFSNYCWNFVFSNNADSNRVSNCRIMNDSTTTSSNGIPILFTISNGTTGYGLHGNYNRIENSRVVGGYASVYYYGSSTFGQNLTGNEFIGNEFKDYYVYGIYAYYYMQDLKINYNRFHRSSRTTATTHYGIYVYLVSTTDASLARNHIIGNRLFKPGGIAFTRSFTYYGIFVYGGAPTAGNENYIANNLIYDIDNTATNYGIFSSSNSGMRVYHNTVSFDKPAPAATGATYCIYSAGIMSRREFRNNIMTNTSSSSGTKYGYYEVSTNSDIVTNNLYWFSGGLNYLAYRGGTNYATLVSWQATGKDAGAAFTNPNYLSLLTNNYRPTTLAGDNIGIPASPITTDIFLAPRSATTPDAGAIEFAAPLFDGGVTALVDPLNGRCDYDSTETVVVTYRNSGINTIDFATTPLNILVRITSPFGVNMHTATISTGTIASGATQNFTVTTTANMGVAGTYLIQAGATFTGDAIPDNDTMLPVSITVAAPVSVPMTQNFDTWIPCTPYSAATACTPTGAGWRNGGGTTSWLTASGATGASPTSLTGPGVGTGASAAWDKSTGSAFGGFLYVESSVPGTNATAIVETPCMDFRTVSCPKLSFWYHMYGSGMGKLYTDVLVGSTWITVDSLVGQQQTTYASTGSAAGAWRERIIRLNAYSGTVVKVRFRGLTGPADLSDMAIDEVSFTDDALPNIAITSVASPVSGCGLGSDTLRLNINNPTCQNRINVPVTVTINGTTVINRTIPGPIPAYSTASYSLDTVLNVSTPGVYEMFVQLGLPGDIVPANDTLRYRMKSWVQPTTPVITNDTNCGPGMVTLVSTGTANFNLWADTTAGSTYYLGDTFRQNITSSIVKSVLAITGSRANLGPVDASIGLGANYGTYSDGIRFDVHNKMLLRSVTAYPGGRGNLVVNLKNAAGAILQTYTHFCPDGSPQVIPVNFIIMPGTDYQLDALGSTTPGIYRSQTGVAFPYNVEDVATLTGSINYLNTFYYFFYNWDVLGIFCETTPVRAYGIIHTLHTVNIGPDRVVCSADNYTLDAGNPGMTYNWSPTPATTQTLVPATSATYSVTVTNPANGCQVIDDAMITVNTSPTINIGPDATICGGTTLNAGYPGSTYVWSHGPTTQTTTVTSTGTYNVLVTDLNGCTGKDTIDLTINPLPEVNLGPDVSQCGGFKLLDAVNPTSTYVWQDGARTRTYTVNTAGTYWVEVTTPQGCKGSDTVNVTINPNPVVNLGTDITACGAAGLMLDAGASPAGTTYTWSPSGSGRFVYPTTSGTYSVTVSTAAGCTGTDVVEVVINTTVPSIIPFESIKACGSAILDAGVNPGATFLWSTGATTQTISATATGSYWVKVTNACGNDVESGFVTIDPVPNASFTHTISGCRVTFNNTSTSSADFKWNFGDGGALLSSTDVTTSPVHTFPSHGTYKVVLSAKNDCGTDYDTVEVVITNCQGVGIDDVSSYNVSVYPNPATDILNVDFSNFANQNVVATLTDLQGRTVIQSEIFISNDKYSTQFDISKLASGLYNLKISSGDKVSNVKVEIH